MIDFTTVGTGADAAVVFDGIVSPVAGASLVTVTGAFGVVTVIGYKLTRDVQATSIWVKPGVTVATANYRLLCRGETKIEGLAHNDGRAGGGGNLTFLGGAGGKDTSSDSAGSLPIFPVTGDTNRSGGAGGGGAVNGGGDGSNGSPGGSGGTTSNALRSGYAGIGGSGGGGGSADSMSLDSMLHSVLPIHTGAGGNGAPGGGPGTVASVATLDLATLLDQALNSPSDLSTYGLPGAPGGSGGGGGGGASAYGVGAGGHGGGGGGRGGHGGWLVIISDSIIITKTGIVSSRGGNGGAGAGGGGAAAIGGSHDGGGGAGGHGAGGNGGAVVLYSRVYSKAGTVSIAGGDGGGGGFREPGGSPANTSNPTGSGQPGSVGGLAGVGALGWIAVPAAAITVIGHGVNCNQYDAIAATNGSTTPPGNGQLIYDEDLESLRNWCAANGISVALNQDSQRSAKDLLDELLTVGNHAPVYSGDRLKLVGYDEVSAAGNGRIYVAPTAGGPIADLDDRDFVHDGKNPPVSFKRKRRADCDNVVSIEHIDRGLDYSHSTTTECDQKAVAMYGPRKGGTLDAADLGLNVPSGSKSLLSIHSARVAQLVGSVLAKRGAAGVNEYSFTLKAEWMHLEAMDLVTLTDSRLGLVKVPVRLTSTKETSKKTLECMADEFVYGLNHPNEKLTTSATGTQVQVNVDPGLVNAPIIFQPTTAMLGAGASPQLWFLVSGADPNFGGCVAFISLDGGASYNVLGNIGPATTGLLTGDFADHADPDTADTLAVNLSESGGALATQPTDIADGFADPCYLEGADVYTWEVVCYTTVALTSAEHYSLSAYIRRGTLGTAHAAHATGKRFGAIDGATFKVDLPAAWIGKTLYFKFAAYNKIGGQQNSLADCTAYTYTPVAVLLPGDFYVN